MQLNQFQNHNQQPTPHYNRLEQCDVKSFNILGPIPSTQALGAISNANNNNNNNTNNNTNSNTNNTNNNANNANNNNNMTNVMSLMNKTNNHSGQFVHSLNYHQATGMNINAANTVNNPNINNSTPNTTNVNNVNNAINSINTNTNNNNNNNPNNTMNTLFVNPNKRAETFVVDEVKVMLKEIETRKHILLSLSPSTNRLKRRAWEEVAVAMANSWPHAPRRTADQVKKKWENLVSKTKRKVRAGHITPDMEWNETNSMVMQFLSQNSPTIRLRYSNAIPQSLMTLGISTPLSATSCVPTNMLNGQLTSATVNSFASLNDSHLDLNLKCYDESGDVSKENGDIMMEEVTNQVNGNLSHCLTNTTTDLFNTNKNLNDEFLTNFSFNPTSLVNFGLPSNSNLPPLSLGNFGHDIQKELAEQIKSEHELRMDIMRLQKQAWILQIELLKQNIRRQTTYTEVDNSANLSSSGKDPLPSAIPELNPEETSTLEPIDNQDTDHSCSTPNGEEETAPDIEQSEDM